MVAPEINLRSIDLNLLTILEKLLIHKHISQAAQALNMSQPAVSRALMRLREQ
ncbi:TPA: LysR family transcriptional regulator, partial [Vibrio cholerae]|nr:LysR family transcriptional regulator [Vibrio cholerae]HDB2130018.1 LysR family transcriptional regulator [Vibrio cholerae]HDB2130021.1 LysR family transcriptional regulator [Vibrio cholerae]